MFYLKSLKDDRKPIYLSKIYLRKIAIMLNVIELLRFFVSSKRRLRNDNLFGKGPAK